MDKIFFTKMSGAGNDFIILDRRQNDKFQVTKDIIPKLCNRRNGIGADGLITIEDSSNHNFIMNYYNADGSTGSLCANGARCALLFASKSGRIKGKSSNFLSNNVEYKGEIISDTQIKFYLNSPKKIKYNFKIKAGGKLINAHYADTGSPHVVIDINESEGFLPLLDQVPVDLLGREIRYLSEFTPDGTNVNFINVKDKIIYIRTYERGVEAETLACGTGSVAAALICYVTHKIPPPVEIFTKGNEKLLVNFDVENSKVKNLSLTGPAKIVFTGEMII
ncbi:MAG: diaminopimelate epimerase [Ignavibacteriaceae bacterium]|jgi:diaminopimelate epimerase|nr:diaminopimelate epimerase [Ignavibacteriaceae bacterium]MCW8823723.1 diaminopimelate epimerase [Ignavibacteriaceae bacterium]MCW8960344.1 diaminopimelate epimerase [Ignavibacteriaceae bacterium]MCW9094588.1 diaminopimelate epimerase [Ignavibacteriaceae bacterium]